jgi:hypothetical protein
MNRPEHQTRNRRVLAGLEDERATKGVDLILK